MLEAVSLIIPELSEPPVQKRAEKAFDQLVEQMARVEGVTEELKAVDQMEWVRRMNNIRMRAEEIVRDDILK